MTLTPRGWWVSFALLLSFALVFSLAVGDFLARQGEPKELGSSRIGEWADLSEHGFRARLDSLDMATQLPNAYNPDVISSAPPGMTYLRVRMTIEPLVGPDDDLQCSWKVTNGAAEQLSLTESAIEGPQFGGCTHPFDEGPRERGVPFGTQTVYVVIAEPLESYTLRLQPQLADGSPYWTFTA
ncbi:MAG: hypothetical protein ABIS84_07160 [Arachnia sp.]